MNLATLRKVLHSPDLRRRILVVFGLLVIFRFLAHVPVPVPDNAALASFLTRVFESNKLLGFADLFSGGALTNFSIIMMGLGPYINASIVVQLFTQIIPKLEALSKEGEAGRRKINKMTRWLALPFSIIQSFAMIILIQKTSIQMTGADLIGRPNLIQWILMVSAVTAGSMLLMWIGEIITEKGIGNGISLLIFCGIVSGLPAMLGEIGALTSGDVTKIMTVVLFVAATLAVIGFTVLLNEGTRNIPVSYAKRAKGTKLYGGIDTHLPLRVITAGVIPIIFAIAFLSIPSILGQLLSGAKTQWVADIAKQTTTLFSSNSPTYAIVYFVLVVAFTFFYTSIVFKSKEISENLQKNGGFIPGIRPGTQTQAYLSSIINRITLAGAFGLGLVAVLPYIAQAITKSSTFTIGGTSLLIVVSVALETLKQLEAQAITSSYDKY